MEHRFIEYLYGTFSKLVEKYGFHKSTELIDEQSYSVEYRSNNFVIKLEKYRREFYVTLYKTGYADNGVNLFNLLSFLIKPHQMFPRLNISVKKKIWMNVIKSNSTIYVTLLLKI